MSKAAAREMVRGDFGIGFPYILFVGNVEPKKNLHTLIRAASIINATVVAAGPCTWGRRYFRELMHSVPASSCRFLGYVTPKQLSALYIAADLFAFPSHIEGFGLPPLEAMACGTPVVASNSPALREVCGEAALYAPAEELSALVGCLKRLQEDSPLRDELIRRGLEQSSRFTWDRAARIFSAALDMVRASR
jgi:glycosyltransferase involved in cell wall biosynthesis